MYRQTTPFTTDSSAGTMDLFEHFNTQQEESETTESPRRHGQKINKVIEELERATLISRRGQRDTIRIGGRKNKNEILALTLSRLIKRKYLHGKKYQDDMELARELHLNISNGEFILVLRKDGRIVTMSDEAEHHLGKTMRSLYTQCLNIFECLDTADGDRLRLILKSSVDSTRHEHRLVCTLRLPKGKRPSRVHEDVKTISMAGHFYACHDSSSSTSDERLFIARCESLISATSNRSNSSQTGMSANNSNNNMNSIIRFILNEDLTVQTVSSNAQGILGYTSKDLSGNWLGRYLEASDVRKFEDICQKHFSRDLEHQQPPTSDCDLLDMYTYNGDGRLTFLCQIRPIRERRKPLKFAFIAQLVDPSLRNEYKKYVQLQSEQCPKPVKAEQVNLVSSSISQTSEDSVVANSPTFVNMGELIHDGTHFSEFIDAQQCSPLSGVLSNAVAPFNINDEFRHESFYFDDIHYPATADAQYWPAQFTNNEFFNNESAEELESFIKQSMYGW